MSSVTRHQVGDGAVLAEMMEVCCFDVQAEWIERAMNAAKGLVRSKWIAMKKSLGISSFDSFVTYFLLNLPWKSVCCAIDDAWEESGYAVKTVNLSKPIVDPV